MGMIETALAVTGIYLLCGVGFAALFLSFGVARMDPAAEGTHIGVRLLLAPGTIALWPVLLLRFLTFRPDTDH